MRTYKTIGVAGTVAILLLSGTVVFAQGRPASAGPGSVTQGTAQGAENQYRPANTGSTGGVPAGNPSGTYRPATTSTTSTTSQGSKGQAAQERMQAARTQGQAHATAAREQVAQRLAGIQDKVKQRLAENLATRFDQLNKTWTDHFMQVLDHYDAILQKVQDRATAAASSGKDTTATSAAITAAKTSIATARTAITAQAAKTYTLNTSTVTTTSTTTTSSGQTELMQGLRTSFQNLNETLFKDLFALRDGPMTDTRKAVQSTLQTLSQIPGVDQVNTTSTDATSTN